MHTCPGTGAAPNVQPLELFWVEGDGNLGVFYVQMEVFIVEGDLLEHVDVILAACQYQLFALGSQQFACLNIREVRKLIFQCNHDVT